MAGAASEDAFAAYTPAGVPCRCTSTEAERTLTADSDAYMCRWLSQARQEFTQGAEQHLAVKGVECADLVQEGLHSLEQEMESWVEQLRQSKVLRQAHRGLRQVASALYADLIISTVLCDWRCMSLCL